MPVKIFRDTFIVSFVEEISRGRFPRVSSPSSFPVLALSRIPNTATCRRRLVALSHDPWRLFSFGVWLTFCHQLEENWAWPAAAAAAVTLPQKGLVI